MNEYGYVGDEGERTRIPHFPGDDTHVSWCRQCQQARQPEPQPLDVPEHYDPRPEDDPSEPFIEFPETFSWDVYQPAP